jgi:DNA polymerase (family X)
MDNREIAAYLAEIATFKELLGENSFKIKAYENAARTVETYPENISELAEKHWLESIKGIGKSIAEAIEEIVREGTSLELEELKLKVPAGVPEMLSVQGMGPKKVIAVWKELGITSLAELENACKDGRIASLPGFGEKSQQKILSAIEFRKKSHGNFLYSEALAIADSIIDRLKATRMFREVTLAGSLRRGKKFVADADILVVPERSSDMETVPGMLTLLADKIDGKPDIIGAGPTKVSIRVAGLQVDFRILEAESYAAGLQYFTGSKEHNTILRGRAKDLGYKLNEYGLFDGDTRIQAASEADIYKALGCQFIPPEIREAQGEIEAALQGELPVLVSGNDVKGIIHMHSAFSDGACTIEELAKACMAKGYEYMGITDHSESARYAGGLTEDKLKAEIDQIKKLNSKLAPFRIFFGIESDIRNDGSLDYRDEILSRFDFIIGSIHTKLNMSKKEATERLVAAISNQHITILGHISGRLLLSREGYDYDEDAVLGALCKHGVVLEHNCNPYRLDPDWEMLRKAGRAGISVSLGPDVHDLPGIDDIRFGVAMARKAWLTKSHIVNCKSGGEIDELFNRRKKR